jgi:hypothetical protein
MDFSNILIHCSSIGKLLTEPVSKSDKESGELSKTAKTHLIEVYANKKYGFKKDIDNKYTDKGNTVEPEAIDMLSLTIKIPLEKNTEIFSNNYFVGTPDVINGNIVYDTKSSWDWITFLSKIPDKLDSDYEAQVNGYMDLLGIDKAYVVYCLIDTPEHIRNSAKYALLRKMNVISEESPEFLKEWNEKESNMIFSNAPLSERILMFPVIKNEELIEKAKAKVLKARIFLQELEQKHLNFNKYE